MAGIARGPLSSPGDGGGRLPLSGGRGAPFGRRLLIALERPPLGVLDRSARRGEPVEQLR